MIQHKIHEKSSTMISPNKLYCKELKKNSNHDYISQFSHNIFTAHNRRQRKTNQNALLLPIYPNQYIMSFISYWWVVCVVNGTGNFCLVCYCWKAVFDLTTCCRFLGSVCAGNIIRMWF